ncbi:hypothetical protein KUCAC02_037289 [Chaenocephalus aceratus]|nr:hypothetical protein KUCAC02_037289 [Chaenocephalus aceratus]
MFLCLDPERIVFADVSRLLQDYQSLVEHLEEVEESIPAGGLVEETEERLTDGICLYQGLGSRLSEQQNRLQLVLDEGKVLLQTLCCPLLESQLSLLGERWTRTRTRVKREEKRLETMLLHWRRYQTDSADLSLWLHSALQRLDFWNSQAVSEPQELESIRDHLSSARRWRAAPL